MKLIYFVLLLFFGAFAYFVVRLTNEQLNDIRTHGASENIIEAETGVLSGNASIQNDAPTAVSLGASGGKYVLLNIQPTPTPIVVGSWTQVGTHPHASQEYNASYKSLRSMTAWNYRLYTGYGSGHQGPTAIDSFDPVSKTFSYDGLLWTEYISFLRPLYGKLYVPTFNGMHDERFDSFHFTSPGKPWLSVDNLYFSYATDIASRTGNDLYYASSNSTSYDVDYSQDAGVSWSENTLLSTSGQMASYNNKLYVQTSSGTKVFDGSTWSTNPVALGTITDPRIFQNKLVYLNGGLLKSFDGSKVTTVYPNSLARYTISGNKAYVMIAGTTRTIFTSTDLANWTSFTTLPSNITSSSMAVLHGKLYVGTTDSKIYELNTPVSTLPEVLLYATDDDISEGNNPGSFVVKRDGATTSPLTVSYTVSGTATNGTDYTSLPGTVTIPAGSNQTTISLNALSDGVANEGNESVILTLSSTTQYDAVEPQQSIVTIYEKPAVSLEMVEDAAGEGTNPAVVRFTRKGDSTSSLTVQYQFPPFLYVNNVGVVATNGSDYSLPGSITIPAGQKSVDLTFTPIDDAKFESDEVVRIEIAPNTSYVRELPTRGLITIADNDVPTTPNLAPNPGFETNVDSNPQQVDGWGGTVDTTVAHSGNTSMKISGPTPELGYSYLRSTIPITPGKRYVFSVYVKTDGELLGHGVNMRVTESNSLFSPTVIDSKGGWKYISASFVATSTSALFDLGWVINGPQVAWFDDVSFREAP